MRDRSALARVFVPTLLKEGGDGQGLHGASGTGFPVGNGLLLTARHVVRPSNRDHRYPITILWETDRTKTPARWCNLDGDEAAIAWEGKGEMDAVLLRCEYPTEVRSPGIVSAAPPGELMQWSSSGYPEAGRNDGGCAAVPFDGHMYRMSPVEDYFHIVIPAGAPKDGRNWRGASGMPICRPDTNIIIGIAIRVPLQFGSERLHAVPACRLRADPEFSAALGGDTRAGLRDQCLRALTISLKVSPDIQSVVRCESRLDKADVAATPEMLAQLLVDGCDLAAVSTGLRRCYNHLLEQSPKRPEMISKLREVIQILVPYLSEALGMGEIREAVIGDGIILPTIPAALHLVAEIYMAGAEARPTSYPPRRDNKDFSGGSRQRPNPPLGGINDRTAQFAALEADLQGKYAPGTWDTSTRHKIDDALMDEFAGAAGAPDMDRGAKIRWVRDQLEPEDRKGRYYLVCRMPSDPNVRRELEQGLQRVAEDYKWLAILKLEGDGSVAADEGGRYREFQRMLPRVGEP